MRASDIFSRYGPFHLTLPTMGLILVLAGCGGGDDPFERVAVEGTVTVDGQPLDRGTIRFIPTATTPGPKTTLNIRDGQFEGDSANGPVPGTHRIEIEPDVSDNFPHDGEEVLEKLHAERTRPERPKRLVPVDRQMTELMHTFAADELNRCEFELVSSNR
ncbi:MAG: hypothetical protein WD070_12785 [Pirellulaceae bacterium]